MVKFIVYINLLFLLGSCNVQKPISYGNYQALSCSSEDENLKKYIFNRNNGYLYFYSIEEDKFIPLNLRKEAGYFSEDIPELSSFIKNNQLVITNIEYGKNFLAGYSRKKSIIDLNTLIKKTFFENKKNGYVYLKSICKWIDPKLG